VATAIRAGRTVNGAEVVAPGDDDPRDNRDRARVVVNKGKLGLAKRVNRKMVRGGQLARFTILVRNPGRVALRGVRTCDRLPGGVEFVRANPRARFVRGQVCWTERILRPKQTKRYRVVVRAFKRTSGRKLNRHVD